MFSMASSHCCVVARPFCVFFLKNPLEAKPEVSVSEVCGDGLAPTQPSRRPIV